MFLPKDGVGSSHTRVSPVEHGEINLLCGQNWLRLNELKVDHSWSKVEPRVGPELVKLENLSIENVVVWK